VKINGWQRIGIIASVAWVLGAGFHTLDSEQNNATERVVTVIQSCESVHDASRNCDAEGDKFIPTWSNGDLQQEWAWAAIVAFVPLPLAWGAVYLVLFLIRWVRRGFGPALL
jgi:hypothetical protein